MTGEAPLGWKDRPVRVLVVDDSVAIQSVMRHVLSRDPRLEVVATARDAFEARALIKRYNPDVLTLDIEMPGMNGLDFLERLMRLRPMPVVMLSGYTQAGSDAAIQALALGAMDCVPKPSAGLTEPVLRDMADRIVAASQGRVLPQETGPRRPAPPLHRTWSGRIVLIGASTGGVAAVETVLAGMPVDCPPIVVSQHMPPAFLKSFVDRLEARFPQSVALALDGVELLPGRVLFSPGGDAHTGVDRRGSGLICRRIEGPRRNGHYPSVDVLFEAALPFADRVSAVLLTGLGQDGAHGMKQLRDRGAFCIGQDEASSVVYGMPRAAADLGAIDVQLPLETIADELCRRRPVPSKGSLT
ncbi:chemotaxis response regulator protein-glutamate methylesterase [Maritimibacter alkaliphilus]|nr:chemotaxis response regulator protein-glutamate methylesterase [Maritimibacter alkaliphilus]